MRIYPMAAPKRPTRRFLRSSRYRMAHLAKQDDGASAVEFAFVLPVLLLLLTGMIDVGMLMLTQNNLMRTAQNAARNLAVAQMDELETEAYMRDKLSNLGSNLVVDARLPNAAAVPAETDVIVTISVPMADVIPIDVIGMKNLFQIGSLQTQVVMRQEVPQTAGGATP